MKYLKAFWLFCTYFFVPQMGKQRRKKELLKKEITYLVGKECAEGNTEPISPDYVSRILDVPLENVEKCMMEMGV